MNRDRGLFNDALSHCVACGSSEISLWGARESRGIGIDKMLFDLSKCRICRCIFINPRPSKKLLETIYARSGHSLREPISLEQVMLLEKEYPNSTVDSARLITIAKDYFFKNNINKKIEVLDIGSGYGFYTAAAIRGGFYVTAINPSVWENNVFERMNGFRPIQKFFEDADFSQNFDLIILNQVLEHIDDPLAFLNRIQSILSDVGVVAIAVPNLDSYLVKLGKDGGVFWIPEHLNCFTKKSLLRLLARANMDVVNFQEVSRFPYYAISNKLKLMGQTRLLCNLFVKTVQYIPLRIFDLIGWGGCLNVLAKNHGRKA